MCWLGCDWNKSVIKISLDWVDGKCNVEAHVDEDVKTDNDHFCLDCRDYLNEIGV